MLSTLPFLMTAALLLDRAVISCVYFVQYSLCTIERMQGGLYLVLLCSMILLLG